MMHFTLTVVRRVYFHLPLVAYSYKVLNCIKGFPEKPHQYTAASKSNAKYIVHEGEHTLYGLEFMYFNTSVHVSLIHSRP